MATNRVSPHILVNLTCPHCKRRNSVAIKRGVSEDEQANIKCAYCQKSWEQVLPGPFMAGPFPK
jgi:transcription elongation factor Elf1